MASQRGYIDQPFIVNGVSFSFPEERKHLKAVNLGYPSDWPTKKAVNIEPLSFIFNYKIFSTGDDPNVEKEGIYIYVKYKQQHLDNAKWKETELFLAIHEGGDGEWEIIREDHDAVVATGRVNPPDGEWIGFWKLHAKELPIDPMVAWGP